MSFAAAPDMSSQGLLAEAYCALPYPSVSCSWWPGFIRGVAE
jgi:hypothetical protein